MNSNRKQQLTALGADALADALLHLAAYYDAVDDAIEQLISTPKELVERFKKKLFCLKDSERFIDWRGAAGFARELERWLEELRGGVDDPLTGIELVATFFETDQAIFERCDDSSGYIGHVFRHEAKELFVDFASRYSDKERIAAIVLKVVENDSYGVRDSLIDSVGKYLPEYVIRSMIADLQNMASQEEDEYRRRQSLRYVESLARQIKDPKLFEKTRFTLWEKLSTAAFIDIAQVYLESDDVETALTWLKKIPEDDTLFICERDTLLKQIYCKQGNEKKLTELLLRKFRSYPSASTLKALLEVIGEEKREKVIADEVDQIMKAARFCGTHAEFLIDVGKTDVAENYLLKHGDKLDGDQYGSLLPIAEVMGMENRHLVTSLIYRSLLISILKRGYTKAYPHGIKYLKNLDKHAHKIADWKGFDCHQVFKEQIRTAHGRKRSFWSKYKGD